MTHTPPTGAARSAPGRTAVVIPAAGRGVRLGPGAPKALRPLGGVPMLVHAVRAMARSTSVGPIVVVAPADDVPGVRSLLDGHPLPDRVTLRVVPGGDTRQESVRLGLAAVGDPDVDVVLVHDAARPLVPVATVDAVVAAVRAGAPAVVPALPVTDTVKQVAPAAGRGPEDPEPVVATPARASLRAVQTPQGFDRAVLTAAHDAATDGAGDPGDPAGATDCAGLVERRGVPVVLVRGHEEAFKVTRPLDLLLAEAVLARRSVADGW
ncbi:2-C-methyl-D-erythritol 4-phosphate cytidylyltransferase [Streptomyces calidiresistens]|uniref:2-C-methyl-D-erythritol 4-phosphate cytidylyltransferase n=1 Tax=Streptomyces calidiresistens TaxID=1485586 RepID=A0A7W3T524_9ACTN|nr:2-C-methyl-D-erythritol 4-phosphate cytidylyltransferase [Streptomyces calidiresistens]MBB0231074.1 2-C-methyl-D-erythritol 4-phosphate cytidylyltransferase [Streptomyces calidiresistens]